MQFRRGARARVERVLWGTGRRHVYTLDRSLAAGATNEESLVLVVVVLVVVVVVVVVVPVVAGRHGAQQTSLVGQVAVDTCAAPSLLRLSPRPLWGIRAGSCWRSTLGRLAGRTARVTVREGPGQVRTPRLLEQVGRA